MVVACRFWREGKGGSEWGVVGGGGAASAPVLAYWVRMDWRGGRQGVFGALTVFETLFPWPVHLRC
jgi:hypothetical protein